MNSNIYEPFSFMKQTFKCISYDSNTFRMEFIMEPKGFVPTHFHKYMDEYFEILSGQGEFIVDGKKLIANPGDKVFVNKGLKHSLKTISSTHMKCNVVYSPCSDTHKMFAIFGGLKKDGNTGMSLIMKGEYLCRKAGLETFSNSPGLLGIIEGILMGIFKPIGQLLGWDKLIKKYLSN